MISRRVRVLFRPAISWVVMALSEDFTEKGSKCRSDDKRHKTT